MRAFYTDPLAASWMAKHFGMRIKCSSLQASMSLWSDEEDVISHAVGLDPTLKNTSEKYFVHPDSLHLLDPQTGDLVLFDSAIPDMVIASLVQNNGDGMFVTHPEFKWLNDSKLNIIQRKGKAFMWPEVEP